MCTGWRGKGYEVRSNRLVVQGPEAGKREKASPQLALLWMEGPPAFYVCEECLRWLGESYYPRSVLNSMQWHYAHPGERRGTTEWTCKECRAQKVADKERLDTFRNFRQPEDPVIGGPGNA